MFRLLPLFVCVACLAAADPAARLYKEGRKAERQGDDLQAYTLITRAAGMRPQETKYRADSERLRVRAAQGLASMGLMQEAALLDPPSAYPATGANLDDSEPEVPPPSDVEIRKAENARGPIDLQPQPGRRNFDLPGNLRTVWEQVARAFGIDVVFDPELTGEGGAPFRFRLDDADFRQALRALMTVTATFAVPVREHVMLVVKDTQPKRTEFDPMMEALLPIPQVISIEEANEIGRAVQQVLDIKRLAVDASRRQIYVRDTVSRVRLAQALYEELSRRRGEVMLEIELLGVSRSNLTNLGLTTATGFVAAQGSGGHVTLGGGETLFGIQIADSNFEASASHAESRLLTSFRLRATDGLAASMHIGDHYPIVNAVFSPIVFTDQIRNLQQSGQLRPPFPSFTFEDLGLILKVTPRIHDSQEVSLSLEAAFRLLSGDSLNGIPVISDRKFTSAVRLREGQTSIISGLVVSQVTRSRSGLAGLLLLSHNTWQFDYNELLVTITPRLISLPPADQFPQRAFYFGTDLRPISPL